MLILSYYSNHFVGLVIFSISLDQLSLFLTHYIWLLRPECKPWRCCQIDNEMLEYYLTEYIIIIVKNLFFSNPSTAISQSATNYPARLLKTHFLSPLFQTPQGFIRRRRCHVCANTITSKRKRKKCNIYVQRMWCRSLCASKFST